MIDCLSFVFFKSLYMPLLPFQVYHIHLVFVLFEVCPRAVVSEVKKADWITSVFVVHLWKTKQRSVSLVLLDFTLSRDYFSCLTPEFAFHIAELLLCPVRIVTRALTKTHRDESVIWMSEKYLLEKVALLTLPSSEWPPFTQGMPPFPTQPTELLLEMGLCYRAPGGLTAGAGGRQEQAPSAMDSSSTLAESARERPELGMTPPSKVPDGFIYRPQLRFPSPLNFPAFLFFRNLFFQMDQYIFQRSITPQHPHLFLLPILLSSPFNTSNPPSPLQSHLVNSFYPFH